MPLEQHPAGESLICLYTCAYRLTWVVDIVCTFAGKLVVLDGNLHIHNLLTVYMYFYFTFLDARERVTEQLRSVAGSIILERATYDA